MLTPNRGDGAGSSSGNRGCFNCGQTGHFARDCPAGNNSGTPQPQQQPGLFANNTRYWQNRRELEDDVKTMKEWMRMKLRKEQEKMDKRQEEEEKARRDEEQRRLRQEQERRQAELRRLNEETELRIISTVAREMHHFRAEIRSDIHTALTARSKTSKEKGKGKVKSSDDHAADELLKYLQGEIAECSRDGEERERWFFTRKNRGQRTARRLGSPEENDDGGEVTPRPEKQCASTKGQGTDKKVPATCSKEGVIEYVLNVRKKLSEMMAQEIKKLCVK
ncbi:hypothetical protein CBR_g23607 [Chara braunii]|uniref:CCHC-type domain-containing protein n=1 Tax=Chara braunii TaxID=69332 RepID=A0A388L4V4_CHABU|nr:hypothetical protein CBR_g23607 [Chara braunii]|eukprot:GBG77278.1 hypothetical protein CBR_g23607 [Chara braunii]